MNRYAKNWGLSWKVGYKNSEDMQRKAMKWNKKHRQHGRCHSDGKGLKNFPCLLTSIKKYFFYLLEIVKDWKFMGYWGILSCSFLSHNLENIKRAKKGFCRDEKWIFEFIKLVLDCDLSWNLLTRFYYAGN